MEHHRSCVLPSNAPSFAEHDPSIPSRVLQERSANRRHAYADASNAWKRSPSTPVENLYAQGLGASYFAGNLNTQLNSERSEEQIEHEAKRLLRLLHRCEKYQKYRDRQPQTQKEKEQKWPDHLEEAFFRGLVRWPPMGRRKHMLDGQLRGRNELVADSIQKDTGEPRTRKQVSSHIQVLKNILSDQPQILVYMSTEDLGTRKRHGNSHFGHLRTRHQNTSQSSRYNQSSQAGATYYPTYGSLATSVASKPLPTASTTTDSPFTVAYFSMLAQEDNKVILHNFTQLAGSQPRLPDLNMTDTTNWRQQYAEFRHLSTDEWRDRQVLVCTASIKVMQRSYPGNDLSVHFHLESQTDLSHLAPLHCETRFYDNGELADKFNERKQGFAETSREVQYRYKGAAFPMHFGSGFWARRMDHLRKKLCNAWMNEDLRQGKKEAQSVRDVLQQMTAVQDVYGVNKETGESQCFLTILWRFEQTRAKIHDREHEDGSMKWRVANFGLPSVKQSWNKVEALDAHKDLRLILNSRTSTSPTNIYNSLPLDLTHQAFSHHPPPLDLDSLSGIAMDGLNDFSNPNSATTHSLSTDYSHTQSIPSLTHSHDTNAAHNQAQDFSDANDIDFHSGSINLRFLDPPINFGTYENSTATHALAPALSSIPGLDHHTDTGFGYLGGLGVGVGVGLPDAYPSSKQWQYNDLISRLEGAAAADHVLPGLEQAACAGDGSNIVGHGVLHGGDLGHGLWKLQSGFGEDTVAAAAHGGGGGVVVGGNGGGGGGGGGRKDSAAGVVQGVDGGSGLGIMDFMDRGRGRERLRFT